MAWGDWLVPKLSVSAEAQMHHTVNVLKNEGPENVDQLVRIACSLAQQNVMQQAIIRQAIGHISLLEMTVELNRKQPPRIWDRLFNLCR